MWGRGPVREGALYGAPLREQTDRQTLVKTLSSHNFVEGGENEKHSKTSVSLCSGPHVLKANRKMLVVSNKTATVKMYLF